VILDHVSLVIEPREFVAIVGPSGAGKTTLMSALAGYQFADRGALRVNGDDFYANYQSYRGILGYVPQDDILHATLTVEEALATRRSCACRRTRRRRRSRRASTGCWRTSR
jgi:ABC-type multidrug transport system ATPase subunit